MATPHDPQQPMDAGSADDATQPLGGEQMESMQPPPWPASQDDGLLIEEGDEGSQSPSGRPPRRQEE